MGHQVPMTHIPQQPCAEEPGRDAALPRPRTPGRRVTALSPLPQGRCSAAKSGRLQAGCRQGAAVLLAPTLGLTDNGATRAAKAIGAPRHRAGGPSSSGTGTVTTVTWHPRAQCKGYVRGTAKWQRTWGHLTP